MNDASNSFNWPLSSSAGILFRLIYGSPNDVLSSSGYTALIRFMYPG